MLQSLKAGLKAVLEYSRQVFESASRLPSRLAETLSRFVHVRDAREAELGSVAALERLVASNSIHWLAHLVEVSLRRGDHEGTKGVFQILGAKDSSGALHNQVLWRVLHSREHRDFDGAPLSGLVSDQSAAGASRRIDLSSGVDVGLWWEGLDRRAVRKNATVSFVEERKVLEGLGCLDQSTRDRMDGFGAQQAPEPFASEYLKDMNHLKFGFQTTGLLSGRIVGYSLWSGAPLVSQHCFVVPVDEAKQSYTFVRFDDREPWYLMIGSWRGCKSYIYLPHRHCVILLESDRKHEFGKIDDYISSLHGFLLGQPGAVIKYLQSDTKPALYLGTTNNMGHYFWNEIQGLSNAANSGLLSTVNDAVLYKYQFLAPTQLVAELGKMDIEQPRTPEQVFLTALEKNLFCIRPTALRMTGAVEERVRAAIRRQIADTHPSLQVSPPGTRFRLWYNLRSHNKVWLEQVQGLREISTRLKERYPSVQVVLDGTPDCAPLVEEIRSLVVVGVEVIDATRIDLTESLAWAMGCDAYVATIGSGLTLPTWIAGRPGVAHSEKAHLSQLDFWGEVRPGVPAPRGPSASMVSDEGGGMYCNYHIDPNTIADLFERSIGIGVDR